MATAAATKTTDGEQKDGGRATAAPLLIDFLLEGATKYTDDPCPAWVSGQAGAKPIHIRKKVGATRGVKKSI